MNCAKCLCREYFQYALGGAKMLWKNIFKVIRLKLNAIKLIALKNIFLGKKFHSPLMPLAATMINQAMSRFPLLDRAHLKCIVETNSCLIEVAEKLTHCDRVNGRLKVYDYGRYAITFYDSETLEGVRASVDVEKLKSHSPYLYAYFVKTSNVKIDFDHYQVFFEAVKKAPKIIDVRNVTMDRSFAGRGTGVKKWGLCPKCGEAAHMASDGPDTKATCIACAESKLFQNDSVRQ